MIHTIARAKVNIKVVIVLSVVLIVVGAGAFLARYIRRRVRSSRALEEGRIALAERDWPEACKHLRQYLGYHPDDTEMLKKYAEAHLATEPLELRNIAAALSAYRRLLNLVPGDKSVSEKLCELYFHVREFSELAYVASRRLERAPDDVKAPLWLARSLVFQRKHEKARQTLLPLVARLAEAEKKHPEYVEACWFLSRIAELESTAPGEAEADPDALDFLNRAVRYDPKSPEALMHRATFYRAAAARSGAKRKAMLAAAVADMDRLDALAPRDPRVLLFMCSEWMQHGRPDKAEAKLRALESLDKAAIRQHFLDLNDWVAARFVRRADLAIRKGDVRQGVALADEALTTLKQRRHRGRVLVRAIRLYLIGDKVKDARRCLEEYLEALAVQQGLPTDRKELVRLRAMVARAEGDHYAVIEIVEPETVQTPGDPLLWRLLAESYSGTDQTWRAIRALNEYLRLHPRDPVMTAQLTREYVRRHDWESAYDAARRTEALDSEDTVARLLRIETSIYVAADRPEAAREAWLKGLAGELIELRGKHPKRLDIRILESAVARVQGRVDLAETHLKQAIKECEQPLDAELELARLYFVSRRLPEAVEVCEKACERHPQTADPWLTLGELHRSAGQYPKARSTLQAGLEAVIGQQGKRTVALKLAVFEIVDGDRRAGIEGLRKLVRADRREVYARLLLLGLPDVRADGKAAQALVDEMRQTQGETGLLWRLHQADLWLSDPGWRARQQDIADALARCIEGDPEWSAPALLLSRMHERLGNLAAAEAVCRRTFSANPSATGIADRLVSLLEKQARFSEAKQVLDNLATSPRGLSVRRIRLAIRAGEFDRAIDELKLRIANDKDDANSRMLLARLSYWQTKDAALAMRYLEEAEAIVGPGSMAVTAAKVAIMKAGGQLDQARRVLDDHVKQSQSFGAHLLRAAFLADTGKAELAEKDYVRLTALSKNGRGYEVLAAYYARCDRLDDSVAALEKGLKACPDDLRLEQRLMRTLLLRRQKGDQERAGKILAELQKRRPDNPGLLSVQARLLLQEAKEPSTTKAEQILERVVQLEPIAVNAHLMLIGIAQRRGEYAKARDRAIRALGASPRSLTLLVARARAERALNNLRMAANLAQMVLKQDRDNAEARDVLVEVALSTRDQAYLEEALHLTDEAIKAEPKDDGPRLANAFVLNALGQRDKAIEALEAYRRAQQAKPGLEVLLALAELYRVQGDVEKAGHCLDQASKASPDSPAVVRQRLIWLGTQERFDEVGELVTGYRARRPTDTVVSLTAAAVLATSGTDRNLKDALELYEQVVRIAPELTDARLGMASVAYKTGDGDRAVKIYRETLKREPQNVRALNDLAWILSEHLQDHQAALELATRGVTLDPDNRHLLDTRGVILSRLPDRLDDARKNFERLLTLTAADSAPRAKALLQLGRVCARLKDAVNARRHLESALKIDRKRAVFTSKERSEIQSILDSLPA